MKLPVVQQDRLARFFVSLCEIDSPSRGEARVAAYLRSLLQDFGAISVVEDDSAAHTGSECGNLFARFAGKRNDLPHVCFCCHMDVIAPCIGVKVRRVNDLFMSDGRTVLGGDDKAGIAILLEVLALLSESGVEHSPFELLFTTCEEIGLLGAKAFDCSQLHSTYGYALDSTGIDNVIIGAPASHAIIAEIHGLAAHAGLRPRHGINAIQLASQAVAQLPLGALDDQSTANIGLISGGCATNIIPAYARVEGEIRSHNAAALDMYLARFRTIFQSVIEDYDTSRLLVDAKPSLIFHAPEQYPLMRLSAESLPVRRALSAQEALNRPLSFAIAGGGSDANIFFHAGLPCAILGIGMEHVHSTAETISLTHMVRTAELVFTLLTC